MSALWGNATWILFHTFAEKVNEHFYQQHYPVCLNMFKKICQYLPCPVCCEHATAYLKYIKPQHVNTKAKLQHMFYTFHNEVNRRIRTPLYPKENLILYREKTMNSVLHNFVQTYAKKYNSTLLAGQISSRNTRRRIAHSVLKWFRNHWQMFHP
tara:strand:- start:3101 stop:3562 length:462 start_codon:yes stop_codon:yes gene_type:complete